MFLDGFTIYNGHKSYIIIVLNIYEGLEELFEIEIGNETKQIIRIKA
jgi:hypothetical protein